MPQISNERVVSICKKHPSVLMPSQPIIEMPEIIDLYKPIA